MKIKKILITPYVILFLMISILLGGCASNTNNIDNLAITATTPSTVSTTAADTVQSTTAEIETVSQVLETDAPTVSSQSPDLKIHFIDVGQGDSALIESNGQYMLIDAGNNDKADLVVNYLKSQGVTALNYLIGTHPDADHIGGLDVVINSFDIGKIIMPPVEHTTKTFEDVLDAISNKGLKLTKPVVGTEYQLGSGTFTIIAPNTSYGDELNNWSIGVKLVNGKNSFVMCGDAEADAEHDICANNIDIKADVLKLGHHGSSTSSSEEFLNKVNPSFAIISCAKDNSYGHPHQETIDKLAAHNIKVFRTDINGTIIATSNGADISWNVIPTDVTTAESKSVNSVMGTTTPETTVAKESASKEYILNTNTKKFHYPSCSSVKQMSDKNKKTYTGSHEEVVAKGYVACKKCNP